MRKKGKCPDCPVILGGDLVEHWHETKETTHTPTPDGAITIGEPCPGCGEYPRWNGAQHCDQCAKHWDESILFVRQVLLSHEALLEAAKLALATIERLKPSKPYDSTQGTRDVINAAIARAEGGK